MKAPSSGLPVINGPRNRGVKDLFIACTDNLTGFAEAVEAVFPKTENQNCVIYLIRNSKKYVTYKNLKVYAAVAEPSAPRGDKGEVGVPNGCCIWP